MAYSHDRTLLASLAFADPDKKDPLHDLGCQYIGRPEVVAALGGTREHTFQVGPFDGWTKHPQNLEYWYRCSEVVREDELAKRPGTIVTRTFPVVVNGTPAIDVMLTKGEGKYATTIGFIDTIVPRGIKYQAAETEVLQGQYRDFSTEEEAQRYAVLGNKLLEGHSLCPRGAGSSWRVSAFETKAVGERCHETSLLLVEVKIKEVGVGDVLRQVNLYRAYADMRGWGSDWLVACAFKMSSSFIEGLRSHRTSRSCTSARA